MFLCSWPLVVWSHSYRKLLAWSLARATRDGHVSAHTHTRPIGHLTLAVKRRGSERCGLWVEVRVWVVTQQISLQGGHRLGRLRLGMQSLPSFIVIAHTWTSSRFIYIYTATIRFRLKGLS
jgi:hypothetical protein